VINTSLGEDGTKKELDTINTSVGTINTSLDDTSGTSYLLDGVNTSVGDVNTSLSGESSVSSGIIDINNLLSGDSSTVSSLATVNSSIGDVTAGLTGTSGATKSVAEEIAFLYGDTSPLAKDTSLTGDTNSVSAYISALMGDGVSGVSIASVEETAKMIVDTGLSTDIGSIDKSNNEIQRNTAVSGGLVSSVTPSVSTRTFTGDDTYNRTGSFTTDYGVTKTVVANTETYEYVDTPEEGSRVIKSKTTYPVYEYFDVWPYRQGDSGFIKAEAEKVEYEYYAEGGFTGKSLSRPDITGERPAGIVHEDEWVANKRMVKSNPMLFKNLESIQQGGSPTSGGGDNKMSQYMFVMADEIKKLNSLVRQVTNGGDAMRTELVR
jgi:hypothetical protein